MDHQINETQFDEMPRGLRCLCGSYMMLAVVEPGREGYKLHRFECERCHARTSVSFSVQRGNLRVLSEPVSCAYRALQPMDGAWLQKNEPRDS
jgi:hypothetical protein